MYEFIISLYQKMPNTFAGDDISSGGNVDVTDGSVDIYGKTVRAVGLQPNLILRTGPDAKFITSASVDMSEVVGLNDALDAKAGTPIAIADVDGLQSALAAKSDVPIGTSDVTGLDTTLTDLQNVVDTKADQSSVNTLNGLVQPISDAASPSVIAVYSSGTHKSVSIDTTSNVLYTVRGDNVDSYTYDLSGTLSTNPIATLNNFSGTASKVLSITPDLAVCASGNYYITIACDGVGGMAEVDNTFDNLGSTIQGLTTVQRSADLCIVMTAGSSIYIKLVDAVSGSLIDVSFGVVALSKIGRSICSYNQSIVAVGNNGGFDLIDTLVLTASGVAPFAQVTSLTGNVDAITVRNGLLYAGTSSGNLSVWDVTVTPPTIFANEIDIGTAIKAIYTAEFNGHNLIYIANGVTGLVVYELSGTSLILRSTNNYPSAVNDVIPFSGDRLVTANGGDLAVWSYGSNTNIPGSLVVQGEITMPHATVNPTNPDPNTSHIFFDVDGKLNHIGEGGTVVDVTDHTHMSNIGINTHDQIDAHIALLEGAITVTEPQVAINRNLVVNNNATVTANDFVFAGGGDSAGTHITNDAQHRLINDNSTAATDLWSASKIDTELASMEAKNQYLYSTGIVSGATLQNNNGTSFDVSSGTAVFRDGTIYTWADPITGVIPNVASFNITFIAIDANGTLHYNGDIPFTVTQTRTLAVIGVAVHTDRSAISTFNQEQFYVGEPGAQLHDLMNAVGVMNVNGNIFSGDDTDPTALQKSQGDVFRAGSNFFNDTTNPNVLTLPSLVAPNIEYRYPDGTSEQLTTAVDATSYMLYNPGTGVFTKTGVGNNKFSVQRIYSFLSNNVKLMHGQAEYGTMTEALANIGVDDFTVEPSIAGNGIFRAFLVVQNGYTDLKDPSQARFVPVGKFGESIMSGAANVADISIADVGGLQAALDQRVNTTTGTAQTIQSALDVGGDLTANNLGFDANNNIFIGNITEPTPTGTNNNIIGKDSGDKLAAGTSNNIIGTGSGVELTGGNSNQIVGNGVARWLTTGNNNVAIGTNSLGGWNAGPVSTHALTGAFNVNVGFYSGRVLQGTATSNTYIGTSAGVTATTGSYNVCVGHAADPPNPGDSHKLVISSNNNDLITGEFDKGNIALSGLSTTFGGGTQVIAIKNSAAVPTANPVGGGFLYVEAGALKYRGSGGKVTTIADASV
jgi:hypothetical protein